MFKHFLCRFLVKTEAATYVASDMQLMLLMENTKTTVDLPLLSTITNVYLRYKYEMTVKNIVN